ncbi:MAG: hypothetical protein ACT4QA_15920 [Panacagrimonas sp.]
MATRLRPSRIQARTRRPRRHPADSLPEALRLWFQTHRFRFAHPPTNWSWHRGGYQFTFRGITASLGGSVGESSVTVFAEHQGEQWDTLRDFETSAQRRADGRWYCLLCERRSRGCFNTRQDLWRDHCFEPLTRWIGEFLKPGNRLALRDYGGMTEALILPKATPGSTPPPYAGEISLPLRAP